MDMVDGRSSPAPGAAGGFESYCDKRRREALSATEPDGIEARFSPPRLGQTPAHDAVVPSSSAPVVSVNDTGGSGGVYSLFSGSTADNSDFASEYRRYILRES